MLLAALLDAGADLEAVRAAIAAVLPEPMTVDVAEVRRAGLRAAKLDLAAPDGTPTHRDWTDVQRMLEQAPLDEPVRADALRVFAVLAGAEAAVHGIPADEVHFHEVGALDSIADIVGCCAARYALGLDRLTAGPLALGSGTVRTEHGTLPVPVPAVLELARGWPVAGGGAGELATPTGVALIATLATYEPELPPMRLETVGIGAGTADPAGRANVVRVIVGERLDPPAPAGAEVVIEANVDDLDGRVWPTVIDELLAAGAADAWLTPIVMKKGRPAHTLHVLAPAERVASLRELIWGRTSTFGVRVTAIEKHALPRSWVPVPVAGGTVRIKVAARNGVIVRATPEFEDVRTLAEQTGRAVVDLLHLATAAAHDRGLIPGGPIE
jgi:uncharacterized protein (TIGR00299 family) protein